MRKFKTFWWKNKEIVSFEIEYGTTLKALGGGLKFFGEDNTIMLMLHFWHSLWIGISIPWINRKIKNYDWGWRLGAHFSGRYFQFDFFEGKDRSTVFWDWVRFLSGNPEYRSDTIAMGSCEVIMPEKRYDAEFKIVRQQWYYKRWFIIKQMDTMQVEIPKGIPVPGKGENSWDCGDDRIYGLSRAIDYDGDSYNRKQLLDELSLDILKRRAKYASIDWLPEPDVAEEIVEAHENWKLAGAHGATDHALGKA